MRKSLVRKLLFMLSVLSLTLCLWLGQFFAIHQRPAQATDASALVQTGVDAYRLGDYPGAIAIWQRALAMVEPDNLSHQAILLENLARAHRQTGQFSDEIDYWQRANQRYGQLDDFQSLGRTLTEQAQAHNYLGQHRRAIALLCGEDATQCTSGSAVHLAQASLDSLGEAAALASLGETYRLTGDYDQAITTLNQGLTILGDSQSGHGATVLNSLGNTYAAQAQVNRRRAEAATERGDLGAAVRQLNDQATAQSQTAVELLQRSYELAQANNLPSAQVRTLLSLIPLYQSLEQPKDVAQTQKTTRSLMAGLPDSQEKVFAMLTFVGYLEPQSIRQCPSPAIVGEQTTLLNEAAAIAKKIQSSRAESFALGQLGNLYERCGDYAQALELTQAARLVADQNRSAQESAYLWAWQQGRIFKAQGKSNAAATAYTQALGILDSIRGNILSANQELQFDFRDQVEPIYREFAALKLADVPTSTPIADDGQTVDTVLTTLDSLKLAELQNYFANDCVIVAGETRVDTVSEQSTTAIISTAIWDDNTAVIASLPNGKQQVEWIPISADQMSAEANELRIALEKTNQLPRANGYKAPSIRLYNQLIRPFEDTFDQLEITELTFINDGILRGIPMAALFDGQQFLIEKYAIATTPSLTLTNPNPLDRANLNALVLGLSEEAFVDDKKLYFPALSEVNGEVSTVKAKFPGSQVLTNQAFSKENLRQALKDNSFQILHIATHGLFGAEPKDNFIVTGQKVDGSNNETLTISELDALIRSVSSTDRDPIDLLTLTACQTAIGDSRAVLGLAGVAIRAGVRSAIASLWAVNDTATADLITRFYNYLLDPNLSKAEALRKAQLDMIQSNDYASRPYYWAPFILIGNWL